MAETPGWALVANAVRDVSDAIVKGESKAVIQSKVNALNALMPKARSHLVPRGDRFIMVTYLHGGAEASWEHLTPSFDVIQRSEYVEQVFPDRTAVVIKCRDPKPAVGTRLARTSEDTRDLYPWVKR